MGDRDYRCNLDMVFCIDKSNSMKTKLDDVKEMTFRFIKDVVERFEEMGLTPIKQIRVKIITFGNYKCDENSISESDFYVLPNEMETLRSFMENITVSENDTNTRSNALEAFALAMNTEWAEWNGFERRHRHAIFIFTDKEAEELGTCNDCPGYPKNMPKTLEELEQWWAAPSLRRLSLEHIAARLVVVAPCVYPWKDMEQMDHYWPLYIKSDVGFKIPPNDLEYYCALDLVTAADSR